MAMTQAQIRESITERIVAALEKGRKPWMRPWSVDPNMGHPTSMSTKKTYNGINPILLDIAGMDREFQGKYWATFAQWKKMGAAVNAGEKATWIVFFNTVTKKAKEEDEKDEKFALMKYFAVFNIDQVGGTEVDRFRPTPGTNEGLPSFELADETIKATNASIGHGGNSAFFRPAETFQTIKLPFKSKFDAIESYYSTLFHELSHWADHALGAKMSKRFGDDDYFFGELVAEISACYLSEACDIPKGKRWGDSVDYLGSWIEKMKKDNSYVLKAASRASQVSDYILNFSRVTVEA